MPSRDGTAGEGAREARGWAGWVVRPEVPLGQSRRAPHAAVLVATFVICGLTATARAEDERPASSPTPTRVWCGGGTGLAAGYLVAREGGLHSSDWKPLTYGVASARWWAAGSD